MLTLSRKKWNPEEKRWEDLPPNLSQDDIEELITNSPQGRKVVFFFTDFFLLNDFLNFVCGKDNDFVDFIHSFFTKRAEEKTK